MTGSDQQFWATFSIYDFRTPRMRQALVFMDKLIVPVPETPYVGSKGSITSEDIDRLNADVDYLANQGLAVKVVWKKKDYDEWQKTQTSLAAAIIEDPQAGTRYQLKQQLVMEASEQAGIEGHWTTHKKPMVIPVYTDMAAYTEEVDATKNEPESAVLEIACSELPMPADDESLENIVRLRERASFKALMPAFRRWQGKLALDLLKAEKDPRVRAREIDVATQDLQNTIQQFEKAAEEAGWDKAKTGLTLPLLFGAGATAATAIVTGSSSIAIATVLGGLADKVPKLFEFRKDVRKWWKPLMNEEFAYAGIIFEAQRRS